MKRYVPLLLVVVIIAGCGGSDGDQSNTTELVLEAEAVLDAYFDAWNDHDPEAFLGVVNPAIYEYVFSDTSWPAEDLAGGMEGKAKDNLVLERFEQIDVKVAATTETTYYVAVTAERTDDEIGGTVNGIIVLKLTLFPERGWLVTLHHNFGM